jgi:predicted dehydrogenase
MKGLILGLGSIAQKHVQALKNQRNDIQLFAVRSGYSQHNVEGVFNLTAAELNSNKFNFAIISNPTYQHVQALSQLITLGIPLIIEKPLFQIVGDVELNLVEEINKRAILTYVACNLRFHPCIRYFKDIVLPSLSTINEVNVYGGSYLPDWRPNRDFRNVYSARADMGGGVHLDHIHELDYIYWFFGKPLSVTSAFFSKSDLQITAIDNAHYLWEYPKYCVNFSLNYYRRTPKRQIEVLTDKGEYLIDLMANNILFNNQVIVQYEIDRLYTYNKQMEYFMNCITENKKMMNDVNEALDILKLCLNETKC